MNKLLTTFTIFLILGASNIAIASTKLAEQPYQDTGGKIKFTVSPTDCWTTGINGCSYIHRNEIFGGVALTYGWAKIGVVIPVTSSWKDVTSFQLSGGIFNTSYPLNIQLYTMNTNNPNGAKTLIQSWNQYATPNAGSPLYATSYLQQNLGADLPVTDSNGNLIFQYLFIEIRNAPTSISDINRLGIIRTSNSAESNVWIGNDEYSAGSYTAGTYISGASQNYDGNMIYPAYQSANCDYFNTGNGVCAPYATTFVNIQGNPSDSRTYIKNIYYAVFGDFRFPQKPEPTPSGTGTAGGTPIQPPNNTPPDAGAGIVVIPDFSNPTAYCPNCQGNESKDNNGSGTVPSNTGISETMVNLGYCTPDGGCTIYDFINFFYDLSVGGFALSLIYIIVKMFPTKKRRPDEYNVEREYRI